MKTVYRCRVCKKWISRAWVDRALARGKVPAYDTPRCRNTGKARIRRAHLAIQTEESA